jgi:hypothetical protein
VAVTFLLSRPTFGVVTALGVLTLPGASVSLFVLGQVARALEDLVTIRALLVDVHGRCVLLAAGHRTFNALISGTVYGDGALDSSRGINLERLSSGQGNWLAILHNDEFSRLPVLGQTAFEGKIGGSMSS